MSTWLNSRLSWLLAGVSAIACALDLEASGAGKACTANGRCAPGHFCSSEGRCVPAAPPPIDSSPGAQGSAGSKPSAEAAAGSGGGKASADADAEPDGGEPLDGSIEGDGCGALTTFFADDDADGFGRSDSVRACAPPSPAWTTEDGDCDDDNPAVFPGQGEYFDTPFTTLEGDSFDYDCSGSEDPDPNQAEQAPDCATLGVLDCRGSGFAATGRTGSGVNPICGSDKRVECGTALLGCGATTSNAAPARCR